MTEYSRKWLKQICDKVDLLDYASRSFEFRRVGHDEYSARCNKHNDNDPSLTITPSKNLWYCYGCKRGGNIINWLMVYEGLSFPSAVEKVAEMCGEEIPNFEPSTSMNMFEKIRRMDSKEEKTIKRKRFGEGYMNRFEIPEDGEPHEWIEEGISPEAMLHFGVRIDAKSNRIVYPVYDNDGYLIGAKGRTRHKNYKLLGVSKYINYEKIGAVDYFQGMKENRENILKKNEVIIFEGLKSVMKAYGWGYDNCVSAETSRLDDEQVKLLFKLRIKNVVLAFDNDVPLKQLEESANKLKSFLNVYVINDVNHLLGDTSEKCAPVDCGKEIWEKLYAERKRII